MNPFTQELKEINERLDLPQPTKSHILLEIAADMDDLYKVYLSRGLNEQEAIQKAKEKFDLDDEALAQLAQIHEPLFRKLFDRISHRAQSTWERTALILVLLSVVYLAGNEMLSTQLFLQASKFVWPITGIAFLMLLISIVKFYKLFLRKEHTISKLRFGVPTILFLGGAGLAVGAFGSLVETYWAISQSIIEMERTLFYFTNWLVKTSALLIVSLWVAIGAALVWFFMLNKITKIEQAEAAILLRN